MTNNLHIHAFHKTKKCHFAIGNHLFEPKKFIKLTCDHADLKLFGYIYIFLVCIWILHVKVFNFGRISNLHKVQSGQSMTVNINPENLQTADNK